MAPQPAVQADMMTYQKVSSQNKNDIKLDYWQSLMPSYALQGFTFSGTQLLLHLNTS